MIPTELPPKIAAHIQVEADTGCWIWTRHLGRQGYGRMWWEGRTWPIHRLTYGLLVRPVSDWEVVDHLCRVRDCCNPEHLEPVSPAENSRRGNRGPRPDSCIRGHRFTPENTYEYTYSNSGRTIRQCKQCVKIRMSTPDAQERARLSAAKPERRAHKAEYWRAYAQRRREALRSATVAPPG